LFRSMSEATCGESPDFADAIRATNSTKARMRHPRASDLQPQSLLATNRIFRLTTKCVCIRRFAALLSEGVVSRRPEWGARRAVLRRRLATAAPGGRDPARQALRPGREELAVTEPDPPKLRQRRVTRRGKRGTRRAQNRHGGAPRGERPASGTQGASLGAWRAALCARPRVFRRAPERLSALRPPLVGVSEARRQSPDGAKRVRARD